MAPERGPCNRLCFRDKLYKRVVFRNPKIKLNDTYIAPEPMEKHFDVQNIHLDTQLT